MIGTVVAFLRDEREYGKLNMGILVFGPYVIALIFILFGNASSLFASLIDLPIKKLLLYAMLIAVIGYIIIPLIALRRVFGSIRYGAFTIYREVENYDFKTNKQVTLLIALGL